MLDDFSAVNIESKVPAVKSPTTAAAPAANKDLPAATAAAATTTTTTKNDEDILSDDDFAKQLQAGMAELMGEMNPEEMQAQFESFFKDLGAAAATAGEPSSSSTTTGQGGSASASGPAPAADASFQETIRRTMERMQASGDQATAAAAADSSSSDDFMAELLKQMQAGGLGGEGGDGSEEELSKMLMGMMEQLTNKDILYEPMKELDDKFPEWMAANREKCSEEDRKRYELQQGYVREIVAKFEEGTYSDSNPADREYIVERMQKVSLRPEK